jgi:predicted transcriptional regulator YheO
MRKTADRFHKYQPLADAMAALLAPLAEVVLHDVQADTVLYVASPFSPREAGDPSDLKELGPISRSGFVGPYEKTNWDGKRLRSVSVLLPGTPAVMLCVNLDVSQFEGMRALLESLLRPIAAGAGEDAASLLRHDWHENLNRFIATWTRQRGVDARNLRREDRQDLIAAIFGNGGFEAKRAASYVANLLSVSRATVYNQLAELRKRRDA